MMRAVWGKSAHEPGTFAFEIRLAAALVLATFILLAFDHEVFFLLGDSETYLGPALSDQIVPYDRSFTYGLYFIRPVLALFGSLHALTVVQSFAAGLSALVLGSVLHRCFDVRGGIAAGAALAYTLEPIGFLSERMVMTESFATLFFTLFLACALFYLKSRQPGWLLALAPLLVITVSLRVAFLSVGVVIMLGVALLGWLRERKAWRKSLAHAGILLMAALACHAAYASYYCYMTQQNETYNGTSGLFLVSAWAPLVTMDDFPDRAMGDAVLSQVGVPLADRSKRDSQRFSPYGMVDILAQFYGAQAERVAGQITHAVLKRDPAGVLMLGWETFLDYWRPAHMRQSIYDEQGQRDLNPTLVAYFQTRTGENFRAQAQLDSPAKLLYRHATGWYWIVLLEGLWSTAALILCRGRRAEQAVIWLSVMALYAIITLPVVLAIVRFLHPLAWLTLLSLACLMEKAAACLGRPAHAIEKN